MFPAGPISSMTRPSPAPTHRLSLAVSAESLKDKALKPCLKSVRFLLRPLETTRTVVGLDVTSETVSTPTSGSPHPGEQPAEGKGS